VTAVMVVVVTSFGVVPATAGAQSEATETPARITVDAVGAKLAENGRLRLTDVNPRAFFQAEGREQTQLETYGLAKLLETEPSVVAVVRADAEGAGDEESERLKLSDIKYDFAKGTLTADTESASDAEARPLEDAAPNADADGELPEGPVELVVLDTDTEVAGNEPLPPRGSASGPSYDVPLQIQYSGRLTPGRTIVGVVVSSQCVSANGFRIDASGQRSFDTVYDAEKMKIQTGGDCFFKVAHIEYNLSLEGTDYLGKAYVDGPIQLHVTQTGPRYFISSCNDKWPIESSCRVFLAPATPFVKVTM
jgi:hypothetical protein